MTRYDDTTGPAPGTLVANCNEFSACCGSVGLVIDENRSTLAALVYFFVDQKMRPERWVYWRHLCDVEDVDDAQLT
jgi:hypothetical protein